MAANPSAAASVDPGSKLVGLHTVGLIGPALETAYRSLMASIYGPRLTSIGFDPSSAPIRRHAGPAATAPATCRAPGVRRT